MSRDNRVSMTILPARIWERSPSGGWYSREVSPTDRRERRERYEGRGWAVLDRSLSR